MEGLEYTADLARSVCALPGGGALFVAPSPGAPITLWRTDGPRSSNRIVTALTQEGGFVGVSGAGSRCHFLFSRSGGWSVWSSDGNGANLAGLQGSASPKGIAAASSFAYVIDSVGQDQTRLWRTTSARSSA